MQYSDTIIYVDESGDHRMDSIDSEYPIFVLAFCLFNKNVYATKIVPQIQMFKFKYFGHDMIILHEHEIRKAKNHFSFLTDANKRAAFMSDLTELIQKTSFTIINETIYKKEIKNKVKYVSNPYHLALGNGLRKIDCHLTQHENSLNQKIHIIFEARGKKEDADLQNEFYRLIAIEHFNNSFELIFANKQSNSCGLQIADLVARPIGRHTLMPHQPNTAYQHIKNKILQEEKIFDFIAF